MKFRWLLWLPLVGGCSVLTGAFKSECGDGFLQQDEECDDGNRIDTDDCNNTCHLNIADTCGDGTIQASEQCDDRNLINGDGCDNNCTISGCGNGAVTTDIEDCDDGNIDSDDGCDQNCTFTGCGNHILTTGEQCDDGDLEDNDGCDSDCQIEIVCGDGNIDSPEECDDLNTTNGDGCDSDCQIEPPFCGNGSVEGTEECDETNAINGDGCDINCTNTRCGNGISTNGETCDDGNTNDGDGCSDACQIEIPTTCGTVSGIQTGEECDDGNNTNGDGCDINCTTSRCGNNIQAPNEECDDGNFTTNDGCSFDCRTEFCGDGRVNGTELCDDGNQSSSDLCVTTCQFASCGDGFIQSGAEQCDDSNNTDGDGCSSFCVLEVPSCGDEILQSPEECDDGNFTSIDECKINCTFPDIRQLALGELHTCAVDEFQRLRCWGNSDSGQLGHGNILQFGDNEPAFESGDINLGLGNAAINIATGAEHTCVLFQGGGVKCWGLNDFGQLGKGDNTNFGVLASETPNNTGNVNNLGFTSQLVTGGQHSCALIAGNAIKCWGRGDSGQLGYGNTNSLNTPNTTAINLGIGVTAIEVAAGGSHTCALLADKSVTCWGNGSDGQLGNGSTNDLLAPSIITINLGGSAQQITAGKSHTCALLLGGLIKCWGKGDKGQLGYGSNINFLTPDNNPVPLNHLALAVTAGSDHTCALLEDQTVQCWGNGSGGKLGYSASANLNLPNGIEVNLGEPAEQVIAGDTHTCALLLNSKRIICWGVGFNGQLGYGNNNNLGDNETPASAGFVPVF
jgi:cysteine-rich repeat protein